MRSDETLIESARPDDLDAIEDLLARVALPTEQVVDHLGDFLVARTNGEVLGCVGLEIYGDTAILRSLAVRPDVQGGELGIRLSRSVLERAREHGVRNVVLLTETAEDYFARKLGFETVERSVVPSSVRSSWQFTDAVCQSAACMRLTLQ